MKPRRLVGLTVASLLVPLAAAAATHTPAMGQDAKPNEGFKPKSEHVEASEEPPGGATVNVGAAVTDRATRVYYRYKGVDLPLKKFVEYQGSNPFVEIIDGQDVLWVAKKNDVYRVLDRVLYAQLDTMTGAADDLYQRHRYPAAWAAYKDIYDVLNDGHNELTTSDLAHYPSVKSYLLFRMGQSRDWDALGKWNDSERFLRLAGDERALASKNEKDPLNATKAPANRMNADDYEAQAHKAAEEAAQLEADARALLEQAAQQNDRLWQAQNELGILAVARADRAAVDGREDDQATELAAAEAHFKKALAATDAKEAVNGNLVAVYSAQADIDVGHGKYGDALDLIRKAMELVSNPTPPGAQLSLINSAPSSLTPPASYEVAFSGFQPARGETIVITAEVESALARKYLEIEHARRLAAAHPAVASSDESSAIAARWRKQGERLLKKKRWKSAVAFYTALYDLYVADGAPDASGVPADFKDHVRKSLETSFGERATALLKAGADDQALALYALALNYIPNSRVLAQSRILEAQRRADAALASGRWEDAVREIEPIYHQTYMKYDGKDPATLRTRADLAQRLGAAYAGLTQAALARGDLSAASKEADLALALYPPRPEWKENKGRVLLAMARQTAEAGDLDGALVLYTQARDVSAGMTRVRAAFSRDAVYAQLTVPRVQRKLVAASRSYGWMVLLGLIVTGAGIPAGRASLSAAARRRRARVLRDHAITAFQEKRWNDAVDQFNDYFAVTVGAVEPESYEMIARCYRKLGDYDSALRFFDRAANRMPGRRFNLERAEIFLVRGKLGLALQALRTSPSVASDAEKLIHFLNFLRERDGESIFVTEALAAIQMTAGDLDSARQLYLRILEMDPNNAKVLRNLSELARKAGDDRERRSYLQRLVQVNTDDAQSLRELGNLHARAGDLADAVRFLRRAHEIMPGEGLASRIAELQAELLVREAEAEIERLGKELDTPNRRFRIGELHWRLGRVTEAKKFFEEAANLREFQTRALRYLGLIAVAEGHWEDAISLLRGYLAKRTNLAPDAPEKEARYALAAAYEQLDDHERAAAQLEALFEADPGYKDVAKRIKQQLATRRLSGNRGPIDCPFCHRKVPFDAEYCPHCNYHIAAGGAGKYGAGETTSESTPIAEMTPTRTRTITSPGGDDTDDDPKKKP